MIEGDSEALQVGRPLAAATRGSNYTDSRQACIRFFSHLAAVRGDEYSESVARALLLEFAEASKSGIHQAALPGSVRSLMVEHLERIREFATSKPSGYYQPLQDNFLKDIAICWQKLVPVGARVVDPDSSLWRRLLIGGGVAQFAKLSRFWMRAPRGLGPCLQGHIHTEALADFTEEGHEAAYRRIAELLLLRRHAKGYFAASWLYDPCISRISPHLSYLVDMPLRNGAMILCVGLDESGDSLSKSPTRRELYRRGDYVPMKYALVWPSSALIAWASSESP